jgi:hypothetical protein
VARKFGRAEFHPDSPAARIGGVLSGRILTRSDLRRAASLRLRLECVALVPHPIAVGDGITHAEKVIWHAESATEGLCLPWDATGSVIPVRFDIPADRLPTGAVDGHRPVIWRLSVDGDLPGVDYLASFTVPVAAES